MPSDRDESPSLTPKPLLASEALMEDIAPRDPWRAGARWWSAILGVLLAASGAAAWWAGHAADLASLAPFAALGGVLIVAGVAPLHYAWRAAILLLVALMTVGLGIVGMGPGAPLAPALGEWCMLHLLAAVGLPAALLFRERYRAYAGARYVLATALFLSLPFVGYCLLAIGTAPLQIQVTAGIALGTVCLSLLGFMGANANVGGIYLSALIVGAITVELGSEMWTPELLDPEGTWRLAGAAGFAFAAILGALGAAQLLAARSWAEARAVDFRQPDAERPQLPSIGSDTWSGRG